MTEKEYQQWVDRLDSIPVPILKRLVQDYSNWRHRSMLGRALLRSGKPVPAVKILKSVVNVELTDPASEDFADELEDKIWCLKDLGYALWQFETNVNEALNYVNEAIRLTESFDGDFNHLVRGEIWRLRLDMLKSSGQKTVAMDEADTKIQQIIPYLSQNDSYLFHAYAFKAQEAMDRGCAKTALWFLRRGIIFYPLDNEMKEQVKRILDRAEPRPITSYEDLLAITLNPHVFWDEPRYIKKGG